MIDEYLAANQKRNLVNTLVNSSTVSSAPSETMSSNQIGSSKSDLPLTLHQGKWTPEEEEYVECLIAEFRSGQLPLAEGTSLRIFLSKMLNCNPMRISKKFVNSNYNGKQLYVRKPNTLPQEEVVKRRERLQELEKKFLKRVSPLSNLDPQTPEHQGSSNGKHTVIGADGHHSLSLIGSVAAATDIGGTNGSLTFEELQNLISNSQHLKNSADAAKLSSIASMPMPTSYSLDGRVNRKAAAAGRALLQSLNPSSNIKPSNIERKQSLEHMSSMEIMAELQRRANDDSNNHNMSVASCSSLADLADLQRKASCENILKQSFSRNSNNSHALNPSSIEFALQSLVNKNNHSATMPLSNHPSTSLSNLVSEGYNNIDSLSSRSMLQPTQPSAVENFLKAQNLSNNVQDNAKNWSNGVSSSSKEGSSNNLSDLMMQLSKGPSLSQLHRSQNPTGNSEVNLQGLLLNMNKNNRGTGLGQVQRHDSFAQLGTLQGGVGGGSLQGNLESAASLADLFNSDGSLARSSLGGGLQQNHTFDKEPSTSLSAGSIADFLIKQTRAAQQATNDDQNSTNALLDIISRKNNPPQNAVRQELPSSSLSIDQIHQLLAKQGGNNSNVKKRQSSGNFFEQDDARPWKR